MWFCTSFRYVLDDWQEMVPRDVLIRPYVWPSAVVARGSVRAGNSGAAVSHAETPDRVGEGMRERCAPGHAPAGLGFSPSDYTQRLPVLRSAVTKCVIVLFCSVWSMLAS